MKFAIASLVLFGILCYGISQVDDLKKREAQNAAIISAMTNYVGQLQEQGNLPRPKQEEKK